MPAAARGRQRGQRSASPSRNGQGSSEYALNIDAEAAKITGAPVTIAEQTFHRRLLNNEVSREVREAGRATARALRRAEAARDKIEELDPSAVEEIEVLEDEAVTAEDESLDHTYETAAILLRDEEGNPPDLEMLKEKVPQQLLPRLTQIGGLPVEGPTPTPTTSD